ncbi:MAG: D-aminoacylase [Cyclobacteriaceae bacterium]|nr:D-aminoacylase [Cyclobacteriaceae bacterium]MDW8331556.1 D-aminoacylase [Cyclobacteriaceae bacterium]
MPHRFLSAVIILLLHSCRPTPPPQRFDLIIFGGTVIDGSGNTPYTADVGIRADTIAAIGNLQGATADDTIRADGLVVCPGFINMNSMAAQSLMMDGRAMSDIRQGVTLEIFGEGWSPAPVRRKNQAEADSLWETLEGFFCYMMKKGVSPNIASFVGHTSVRNLVMGLQNRQPGEKEMSKMNKLVALAMEQGALGLSSSLIYPPATFAKTDELIALARTTAQYGGIYITHIRSESDFIYDGLREAFRIANEANIPVEIYHLKINHARNWNKIDTVLALIDSARKAGLNITANMYPYAASNTALAERIPDWVQEGGGAAMRKRLSDPSIRKKVLYEMRTGIPAPNSHPDDVMILGFRSDSLNRLYMGKRLSEVARLHGKNADETVLDLIIADKSPAAAVYFLQSEENVKKIMQQPYVSFGSDGAAFDTTKLFAGWNTHPRAYGTFARVLGKYVREEKVLPLTEAIRRMTSLPATNLKLPKRGLLKTGYYADIVVFNPEKVKDNATYENPKQFATGVLHVLVNGKVVLRNETHTGALPGRVVKRTTKRFCENYSIGLQPIVQLLIFR